MKSRKNLIITILLSLCFNLYAGYSVVPSIPYNKTEENYQSGNEYSYAHIHFEGTLLTIYRTSIFEDINHTFQLITDIKKRDDISTTQATHIPWITPKNGVIWSLENREFQYSNIRNPDTGGLDRDRTMYMNYQTVDPAITAQITAICNPRLQILAGTPDSEFDAADFLFSMNDAALQQSISITTPIRVKLITIPTIQVISQNINFGKFDTGMTTDKIAYGIMRIDQNNDTNNFTINYPTTVNLTNTTDYTTVPMGVDILYGSQTGPSVGNNFDVPASTNSVDLYLKATLPGSSIYNKSLGTYTGSVTVNVSLN